MRGVPDNSHCMRHACSHPMDQECPHCALEKCQKHHGDILDDAMTTSNYNPEILKATDADRNAAFEWLRSLVVKGGPGWKHAAIALEEWARLKEASLLYVGESALLAETIPFLEDWHTHFQIMDHGVDISQSCPRCELAKQIRQFISSRETSKT